MVDLLLIIWFDGLTLGLLNDTAPTVGIIYLVLAKKGLIQYKLHLT